VARDRQRAKQRQADRRAARIEQRKEAAGDGQKPAEPAREEPVEPPVEPPPEETAAQSRDEALDEADLEVGAPPQDLGFSERTVAHEPEEAEGEDVMDEDDFEAEEDLADEAAGGKAARRARRRERDTTPRRQHGRVVGFLVNVWAELQRVQWPDRQAVTTLTGVVLGFVIIAGLYLGALDFVFNKLIKLIL
jgi:preprotein translocase SecE subunit